MRIAQVVLLLALVWVSSSCSRSVEPAGEEAAIRALIERNRQAVEGENLEVVKQTFDQTGPLVVAFGEGAPMTEWATIERAYRDWFAAADEIDLLDTCVQVRIHSSGTAAWATYLTDETDTTAGVRATEHLLATFGLEKHGQTWVVVQAHWSAATGSR